MLFVLDFSYKIIVDVCCGVVDVMFQSKIVAIYLFICEVLLSYIIRTLSNLNIAITQSSYNLLSYLLYFSRKYYYFYNINTIVFVWLTKLYIAVGDKGGEGGTKCKTFYLRISLARHLMFKND